MHQTDVAVKVLHNSEGHKLKQFEQELEILRKFRNPHLLLLIGACPDDGCLIYEHMENGAPAIPWYARFRIVWEVASTLAFLHNSKTIVQLDLKPANVLLDHSFVSKIGDVGLSTAHRSKEMGPVGALPYMDPEYQHMGMISPKSDVYAFGMVIMQFLTVRPVVALNEDDNIKMIILYVHE